MHYYIHEWVLYGQNCARGLSHSAADDFKVYLHRCNTHEASRPTEHLSNCPTNDRGCRPIDEPVAVPVEQPSRYSCRRMKIVCERNVFYISGKWESPVGVSSEFVWAKDGDALRRLLKSGRGSKRHMKLNIVWFSPRPPTSDFPR